MKICIAQTKPIKGNIEQNLKVHKRIIKSAINNKADLIIFPELSLTGYEPELARELSTTQDDNRFDDLQNLSDSGNIIIGVGLPTKDKNDILISMVIFQPRSIRLTYSKQYLYPTELGIFTAGNKQILLNFKDNIISPAICYELSNSEHSEFAYKNQANVYIASVLNSFNGVDDDIKKLSDIAKKFEMTVFMANFVGESGGYKCAGKSSAWDKKGNLIAQLESKTEGFLIFDTKTKKIITEKINS